MDTREFLVYMMVTILPDIVEVIVLPTSANTLLGIDSALQACEVRTRVSSAQENRLKLVHARICEQ